MGAAIFNYEKNCNREIQDAGKPQERFWNCHNPTFSQQTEGLLKVLERHPHMFLESNISQVESISPKAMNC